MKTIHKYILDVTTEQQVEMPVGAECLSVQMQTGTACLWALVDAEAPKTKFTILIHGTGHPVKEENIYKYISTFQMQGGALVFHAFVGKQPLA